jgi:hypothetical protein
MFYLQEGFSYRNFLLDALAIFVFIVWFWLLITIAADLFRRHDISGWIKAIWVRLDHTSVHQCPCLSDLSGERHGGTQCATGSTGAR